MMKEGLLKENIDGEALEWAHRRMIGRPEARKILMVISDGAPVDDSTLSVNPANYLEKHLRDVIAMVERRKAVELIAIGIGHDVTRYYQRAVTITDVEQLAGAMTEQLAALLRQRPARAGEALRDPQGRVTERPGALPPPPRGGGSPGVFRKRRSRCSRTSVRPPRPNRVRRDWRACARRWRPRASTAFWSRAPTRTRASTWPPRDERLAWLTGFTGSAGLAAVLQDIAGVFIDGRYSAAGAGAGRPRLHPRRPGRRPGPRTGWPNACRKGPWSVSTPGSTPRGEIERIEGRVGAKGITLRPCGNLVDRIWEDQPAAPRGRAEAQPVELAGKTAVDKRAEIAALLREAGQTARRADPARQHLVASEPAGSAICRTPRGAGLRHAP